MPAEKAFPRAFGNIGFSFCLIGRRKKDFNNI